MPTCDIAIIIVCAGRHGTTERRAGAPGMNTKYDEATANLKQLLDKRDALRKEELIAAVTKSSRSYEEILAFLEADENAGN